jgi:putative peptidoglycan lipid II flippase
VIVSVIFATSAVLGFAREIVLAAYFGASAQMDALLVALIIPMFFLNMLGEASMGAAVVPVFISFVAPQETREQRRIVGSAFMLLSLVLSAVCAVGIIFAPALARVLAPGFDQGKLELTAGLMRILIPSVLVLGLSNFVTGLLHSFKRFGPAAATGVVYNLAVVLMTIPLAQRIGILAPAFGVLIGCVLQLAIMLPSLVGTGLFPSAGFSFRDPALVRMWRLFWPIFAGGLLVTALKSVDKIAGSFLPAGSISALNYAAKIAGGPSRIFAMSIAVVLFPSFVKAVAEGVQDRGDMIVRGLNLAAFLTLPWTALLIALRTPIVFVILQRGAFDASATPRVALALAIYCLGDFADGISTMVNNAFYSHHDSRTPMLIFVGSNAFRAAAILTLVPLLGYLGIAVGNALAVDVALVILLVMLRRHVPALDLKGLGVGFFKIVAASAGSGAAGWATYSLLAGRAAGSQIVTASALLVSVVPALAVYVALARLMRCEEAVMVQRRLGELLQRIQRPPADLGSR